MKKFFAFFLLLPGFICAQVNDTISKEEVGRILNYLASDQLKGRANFTNELHVAAQFIADEFSKDSLLPYAGFKTYFLPFTTRAKPEEILPDPNGKYLATKVLLNVVGVLPGRSLANEAIIFSAHYDHVGTDGSAGDYILNGANDDASGVTALLSLAHYYSKKNDNERTLIFCAFSGEELGLYGSSYFAQKIPSDSVAAMINIEMIGMHNVAGKNGFYLTGSHYSDLNNIMKENLKGGSVKLVKEASIEKRLFQRSDNYPFALKGIPAHTIMCSDDDDACYHSACDEARRIDIDNMTNIIRAIPVAVRSLVDGRQKPKRINPRRIRY
jgi:hypothetical protein